MDRNRVSSKLIKKIYSSKRNTTFSVQEQLNNLFNYTSVYIKYKRKNAKRITFFQVFKFS